jgi:hypothetical protein
MKLRIKPEVLARLMWSAPDSRITPFCSLCQSHIPESRRPLMIWDRAGACAQLCDSCMAGAFVTFPK